MDIPIQTSCSGRCRIRYAGNERGDDRKGEKISGRAAWLLESVVQGGEMIRSRSPDAPLMDRYNLISVLSPNFGIMDAPIVIIVNLLLVFIEGAGRAGDGFRSCRRFLDFLTGHNTLPSSISRIQRLAPF